MARSTKEGSLEGSGSLWNEAHIEYFNITHRYLEQGPTEAGVFTKGKIDPDIHDKLNLFSAEQLESLPYAVLIYKAENFGVFYSTIALIRESRGPDPEQSDPKPTRNPKLIERPGYVSSSAIEGGEGSESDPFQDKAYLPVKRTRRKKSNEAASVTYSFKASV